MAIKALLIFIKKAKYTNFILVLYCINLSYTLISRNSLNFVTSLTTSKT